MLKTYAERQLRQFAASEVVLALQKRFMWYFMRYICLVFCKHNKQILDADIT